MKGSSTLSDSLEHFHVIDSSPPDVLHDLLEDIVPIELSMCVKVLIANKYFSLESLNIAISFPTPFWIKQTNHNSLQKPHSPREQLEEIITKIGCLRMLPLLFGHLVPEGD